MWTQKITHLSREHTIPLHGAETPLQLSDHEVSASGLQANFDIAETKPNELDSVRKILQMLKKRTAQAEGGSDGLENLRLKLVLLWMLILRLRYGDDEEELARQKKSVFPGAQRTGAGIVVAGNSAEPGRLARHGEGRTETTKNEHLFFEASGNVLTKDGESIPVNIRLKLTDTQKSSVGLDEKAVKALIDPLVINYENDSARLTGQKFNFDLDIDGVPDSITMPASGSAFLALDRNGDGIIGDGSELFGVRSGDGFQDLAAFDGDKNGFIDSADKIYDQLRLFTRNEQGQDVIYTLREKGVAAISLENLATTLRISDGAGMLRKTGFIIRDNRTASTVQHVDLRPEPVMPAQSLIKPVKNLYEV